MKTKNARLLPGGNPRDYHPFGCGLTQGPALSLTVLEKEAGIPARTLQRVKDGRELHTHHFDPLVVVLKKYGWK